MLNRRAMPLLILVLSLPASASAQDFAPHRAMYSVAPLQGGKPGSGATGTYAYELRLTCEGYVVSQRLRLEMDGRRAAVVSEQQSQMTESRDGRKLRFEHRSTANGKVTSHVKGEATMGDDDGRGQSRFSEPEGQSVALPAGTLFPIAIARATVQHAKAGDTGFDAQFFYGEKVKPPHEVNVVIGRVPKRLADVAVPQGAEALAGGNRIYYRGGFFDADSKAKGEQASFEMSSLILDNGIELYGTHEEGEGGIEYRITRLEALPKPNCN